MEITVSTASLPALACSTVSSFSAFSSARSSVASLSDFMLAAMSLLKAAISSLSWAISDSLLRICGANDSSFSFFESRLLVVFSISLSQKDFVSASASASAFSLAMMSLISDRTFTKWSSAAWTLTAASERTGLCRRLAAPFRRFITSVRRASAPDACWPLLRPLLPRSCRNDAAGRSVEALAASLAGGGVVGRTPACLAAAGAPWLRCRSTSFLLAEYSGATLVTSTSVASLTALISSARVLERSSKSFAFCSHSGVSSLRKARSASLSLTSTSFSIFASCFSSVFCATIFSFTVLSSSAHFISFCRFRRFLSNVACASNSS
mmetsp:Transcript_113167/g.365637  ORF Transcript_113167/g.365637 Transcript_113167/m.365637 type:complete len:323 (+) Transcript_113167:597-1565(+)